MTKRPVDETTETLDIVGHLEELRRRILWCLAFLVSASVIGFLRGNAIMTVVKRPIYGLVDELIFISPTEMFSATVKVAFIFGLIICFPVLLYHAWAFLAPALNRRMRIRAGLWLTFALGLFLAGVMFSYLLALPAALKFLIGFGAGKAIAMITFGNYISFFTALILAGGLVFEIPIVMGLLADMGMLKARFLRKKRHYAVLAILILAAVITPTQDIVNMLLFALPMVVLYETGILLVVWIEKRK